MADKNKGLAGRVVIRYILASAAMALFLFVPAGTLDYWPAWLVLATLLIPVIFVVLYFLKKDPAFIESRMNMREKEEVQKKVISFSLVLAVLGFLTPGLDWRFHWSNVPAEAILLSDALVFVAYLWVIYVFCHNRYASRVIEVVRGQKVISSGPYALVRHPMYLGSILMYLALPLALGSYYALVFFVPLIPIFVIRLLNEEEVLRRELTGYKQYCKKTRYRLIPYVW